MIDGVSNQTTPLVVDGTMYLTDPCGSVYGLDGSKRAISWTDDVTEVLGGDAKAGYVCATAVCVWRWDRLHRRRRTYSPLMPRPAKG